MRLKNKIWKKQTDLIPLVQKDSFGESDKIRKVLHNGEWYFSVVDIVGILSDSPIPRNYRSDLKRRDKRLHEVCVQLKLPAADGNQRRCTRLC